MYEALEGTLLAAIAAGGVYALTRQPDPELLVPEPFTLSLRWPDRFRPGHRRAVEDAAALEADTFIGELHDNDPAPEPPPDGARHRHPAGPGRHRRPGPMTLSRADLPSSEETIERAPVPGHPPWDAVQAQPEQISLRTCNQSSWQTFDLPDRPALGPEAAVTKDPPPPPPLRVYEGPEQEDPPTGVWRVRDVLDGDLGGYLSELPEYPED
jgi:hypothetical protein